MAKAAPQKSLDKWTKEKWTTSDGKPSNGKKRYLPEKAWNALTPAERAATNRAKAKGDGGRSGKQVAPQPKRIAKKTAAYRRGA
jgi:hypothetical protein